MLKFTVFFLAIGCVVQFGLTSPVIDPVKYNKLQGPSETFSNDVEVSLKKAATSIQWMIQSVAQLTTSLMKEFFIGIAVYAMAGILRFEIFSMASGNHFYFPEMVRHDLEKEHRIIAIAAYKMSIKLHAAEQMDKILVNVSEQVASDMFKYSDLTLIEKSMKIVFEKLELLVKEDPKLYQEYIAEKRAAELQTYPDMGKRLFDFGKTTFSDIDIKKIEERLSHPVLRSMLVNKQFLLAAAKHLLLVFSVDEFDRYATARWMLEEVTGYVDPAKRDKLDAIYKHALEKTAEALKVEEDTDKVKVAVFSKLQVLIAQEPSLKKNLEDSKSLRATVNYFDKNFLRIDILPF